jgi:hypothetical protein
MAGAAATAVFALAPGAQAGADGSFIGNFHTLSTVASTVPANGDVNPYGMAVVQQSVGALVQGDVLISNFNSVKNTQGTGTTIVQVSPQGAVSVFAQIKASDLHGSCPGGVGLTTALGILRDGWVVVGSLPTKDGTAATAKAGCLIVLNNQGQVAETFAGKDGIDGPWDMAVVNHGPLSELFVTNVMKGTVAANGSVVDNGTVQRLILLVGPSQPPALINSATIGSGFPQRTDPAALVVGATGDAVGSNGTLYVANALDNSIAAIPNATWRTTSAGTGNTVSSGGKINDPLGLTMAPNGDILTVNGANGLVVETTPQGKQIANKFLDKSGSPPGSGALFGLVVAPEGDGLYYVDDATNTMNLLH